MIPRETAIQAFIKQFSQPPRYVGRAPGRVNLLGEHVDYNDGFVLPAAIDRATYIAFSPAASDRSTLVAADFSDVAEFSPKSLPEKTQPDGARLPEWALYPAGVAWSLGQANLPTPPMQAAFASDIPRGSGLSSSAAIELAFGVAWSTLGGWSLPPMQLALLGQKAENLYVGVNCGIMDQFASACGEAERLLLLDCRSLEYRSLPLPEDTLIVVADTSVRRKLSSGGYNERRAACEEAVRLLSNDLPGIKALRDVSVEDFNRLSDKLPVLVQKRARHVVEEIERTRQAIPLLEHGQTRAFGLLMNACHISLRDYYEVSTPELDTMVAIAQTLPGCLGARLTGAGFGGCTINLVERAQAAAFAAALGPEYERRTGLHPEIYICQASKGAEVEKTKVFIAYSPDDISFVEKLADDLKSAGLEVWYELSAPEGGKGSISEMQSAIKNCLYFVAVLSPGSVNSDWVEKEYLSANKIKRKIIPLLYQDCDPPLWAIDLNFIDVQGLNYNGNFPNILKAVGVQPKEIIHVDPSPPIVPLAEKEAETPQQPAQQIAPELPAASPPVHKSKILSVLIIALISLAVLLAFTFWGLPALSARLAPSPTQTFTVTTKPTQAPSLTPTLEPTPTPTTATALAAVLGIGSLLTRPADGMEMLYVPEGSFSMGGYFYAEERPTHTVSLDAYWIDKTEVTNAMYAKCEQAASCPLPAKSNSARHNQYYGDPQYADYPVIWVNWEAANSYCKWAGARLPTEAEWEKAARGTDGWQYPWNPGKWNKGPGNDLLNFDSFVGDTTSVGSYPAGASPYGALDMVGNVWEWVNDWYDSNYYASSPAINPPGPTTGTYRVLHGGAWLSQGMQVTTNFRYWRDPVFSDFSIGFRCAQSPQ